MSVQNDFDQLIMLIQQQGQNNEIASELLSHCLDAEIAYSSYAAPSQGMNKEHLLDIYEVRGQMEMERRNEPSVFGYEELLPALRSSSVEHVCISDITSEKGSYLIFSDPVKSIFIGILKSKRNLSEVSPLYQGNTRVKGSDGKDYTIDYGVTLIINGKVKTV